MAVESFASKQKRARAIIRRLKETFPDSVIELKFKNPFQLLAATILSAQCTDKRVNQVTPALFKKYRTVEHFAHADPDTFEREIYSTGFFRAKTKSIIGCAQEIVRRFAGKVPARMEDLTTLPGVGRKTANVILGNVFDIPGVVVDTHVKRISNRLGLTNHHDPVKIEFDLQKVIPPNEWTEFSLLLIKHGRRTCFARKPRCSDCRINSLCPSREDKG
ncbi:MAG: endonuclease III [Omnitrophica bacterium RIFCSPHIGHO2_02_FULL_49_9]|nr:MAG: endonuclease III [Omnitrophica bacterium RIFCSPHIGHO2_02_FULL_49_9]